MAVPVVVTLEAVQVDHYQRTGLLALVHKALDASIEGAAVVQAGQRVCLRSVPHGTVGLGILKGYRCLASEKSRELEFADAEMRLSLAHPAQVERAGDLATNQERDDDQRLGLIGGAGDRGGPFIEMNVIDALGLTMLDHPARDPHVERKGRAHDQLRKTVARLHRPHHACRAINPIDGEVVIGQNRLQRIRDEVEHALRIQRR